MVGLYKGRELDETSAYARLMMMMIKASRNPATKSQSIG
jgi:hypothetical protein